METLLLARAKYLLDRVSNNVKYFTLDGSPALPAEAAALIRCLGKLGLVEDADAMRKDFIAYFDHEVRLPNTGLDPRLVEFRSTANELFGPFLKYSRPQGDWTVVRLRLIDHFDGLRITFTKLSMLSSPLTPPAPGTGADEGKAGTTTQAKQAAATPGTGEDEEDGDKAKAKAPATATRTKPDRKATKTERNRKQRLAYCLKRYQNGDSLDDIAADYRRKYPNDQATRGAIRQTLKRHGSAGTAE